RELLHQVVFLVGRARGADHADGASALLIANFAELGRDQVKSFFPRGRFEPAILANKRLAQPVVRMREVEGVAALDAQEISIDAALVTIVAAHDLHAGFMPPNAERGLAAIAAVGADRPNMIHLPGTRFVAVCTGGPGADGA